MKILTYKEKKEIETISKIFSQQLMNLPIRGEFTCKN